MEKLISAAKNKTGLLSDNELDIVAGLNPEFFIGNTVDKLVPELSFLAVKNAVPVAFCIATTVDGKKIVFQQYIR